MGIQSIPEHELARLREKAKEITGSQFDYQSSYTELLSRRLNGESRSWLIANTVPAELAAELPIPLPGFIPLFISISKP